MLTHFLRPHVSACFPFYGAGERVFWQRSEPILFGGMMKKLTPRQQAALKRHSVHHTAKHMSEMRKAMRSGKTFTEAHRMAMRRVGK
tara:strand:+ start:193 stop:453 length:261 start_codon:yes stop_codon:yes gene_type:complete